MGLIEATPSIKEDHCIGVQVGMFDLDYSSFDNVTASKPIPTFFSEKLEETLEQLQKSPEFAFQCLQALVSKLFERGKLTRYVEF